MIIDKKAEIFCLFLFAREIGVYQKATISGKFI